MSEQPWTLKLDGESLPEKSEIGGKAWSIAWMRSLGLPVPPAFVITTRACLYYLENGSLPPGLEDEITSRVQWLEAELGRRFGGPEKPLLLAVRSGAAVSMPGMMDTVLNLGIDEGAESALARETGDEHFARDTHRRFYELYSNIVLKLPGVDLEPGEGVARWRAEVEALGGEVPGSIAEQLKQTVLAVFNSWNTRRARRYRDHNNIPHDLGTAVTVQAMVFGNLGEDSGTGVLFSRDPLTGENRPYGEYLPRAQGEDVVSGKFTPLPLDAMKTHAAKAYDELLAAANTLERENRDAQDIEFTVQQGVLYLLQARAAKRSPVAAVRMAVEMADEGLIDPAVAVSRVSPQQIRTLLLPHLTEGASEGAEVVASGEGACPGVAIGLVVTDPDEAVARAEKGEQVILARQTTSPDDVHGMIAAAGVITEMGGSTSHAAVVSRALGRPCVVGVGEGALAEMSGKVVTIEGGSGRVFEGSLPVVEPDETSDPLLSRLIAWCLEASSLKIQSSKESCAAMDDALDLDLLLEEHEPEALEPLLKGANSVKGDILGNEEVMQMVISAGIRHIYTYPTLPALLASVSK